MTDTKQTRDRTGLVRATATLSILLGAALAVVPIPMGTPAVRAIGSGVAIDSSGFHPKVLHIGLGEAVVWTNLDSAEHTVTSQWPGPRPTPTPTPAVPTAAASPTATPAPAFDLVLGPGESGSVTFSTIGAFDYYCRNHPDETARIFVMAEAFSPSPSPGLPDAASAPPGASEGVPFVALGVLLMAAGVLIALGLPRGDRRSGLR